MAKFVNYYDVLQVQPGCSPEVIESAYNALIVKADRDKTDEKPILKAYKVLRDTEARAEHDAELRALHENKIGSYKIVRKIAEGGFGRVYEGVHLTLGAKVCIKHNINISPEDTEMFLKEANAMWDLRHHAIPAVRDMLVLNDGSCALVMSFIDGPTLFKLVEEYKERGETIDAENVAWIAGRVLDALRYLHFHGVIHGDVKPQNIIVQPEEHTAVIVDFGLSSIKPNGKSHVDGFTPMFAAPECETDLPPIPESDFYSLGLTLIYALGGDPKSLIVPPSTPKPFKEWIESLIRKDVKQRPNWEKTNLLEDLTNARIKAFGRSHTNLKKI